MKSDLLSATLQKNLEKLSECHPKLFEQLQPELQRFDRFQHGSDGEFFIWDDKGDIPQNFLYVNENTKTKVPYHQGEGWAEAREVLRNVDLKYPSVAVFFGIGLGFVFKEFMRNRPYANFVACVVENNPQIFLRALCVQDFSEHFLDPTVFWVIERNQAKVKNEFAKFFAANTTVDRNIRILATPMALNIEGSFYSQAAQDIMQTRDLTVLSAGNSIPDQMMGYQNVVDNIPHLVHLQGIKPIYDQFPGRTAISIAAGPSLNEHFDLLRELQGRFPLIACESSLKPLQAHGIEPDFLTAIERDDYVPKFFRNMKFHPRTCLVGPALLKRDCFELFDQDQIVYTPTQAWMGSLGLDFLGSFGTGSSAGNLNLSIAYAMGMKNIIMVGHNLAYGFGTNETHVRGTIDPDRERGRQAQELQAESHGLMSLTQDGLDQVPTKLEWQYYRSQMEMFAADRAGDINLINTAAKGARIEGTTYMPFKEAIEKYCTKPFDIYPLRKKLTQKVSPDIAAERLHNCKIKIAENLEHMSFWLKKSHSICKKIDSWRKTIIETENKGGKVDLEFFDKGIDEVLALKVKAVNQDWHFYGLGINLMLPGHMAFERMINQIRAEHTNDYDLKRDFLLKHRDYFHIWNQTIPEITEKLEEFLSNQESFKLSAWKN